MQPQKVLASSCYLVGRRVVGGDLSEYEEPHHCWQIRENNTIEKQLLGVIGSGRGI